MLVTPEKRGEFLTRQLDLIPSEILSTPITVIGAGAIGGWTTLALAKMGFENLFVFDDDKVDTVNMNAQLYPISSIGKLKAEALAGLVHDFTGIQIEWAGRRYDGGRFPGIVISAVDSMTARKLIWDQHVRVSPFTKAIIDPRMGALDALLYVMDPMRESDQLTYPKSLYSDAGAVQERCTAKATIYTASLLSGLVCKAVVDRLTREDYLRTALWSIAENDLACFKAVPHGP